MAQIITRKPSPIVTVNAEPAGGPDAASEPRVDRVLDPVTNVRPLPPVRTRPLMMGLLLGLTDLLALVAATVPVVLIRHEFGGEYHPSLYWQCWPVLLFFPITFYVAKLYTVPLGPAEEIRRVFWVTTAIYFGLGTITFLFREGETYSRSIFIMAWVVSLVFILIGRVLLRTLLARQRWWGASVLVLGCGQSGRRLVRILLSQPQLGLKPVGILDDRVWRKRGFNGVPILGSTNRARELVRQCRQLRVLVIASEISRERLNELLLTEQQRFAHLLIVPNMHGITSVGVDSHELAGILALHVRHRLLDPVQVGIKRLLDLFLLTLSTPFVVAVTALIALAIKLDSKGPVLFRQNRIGLKGQVFEVLKFRTMTHDAHARLVRHLKENPRVAMEWERHQKLRTDPRITRAGRLLRRTSLDELPQLWNVFRGQMSLVGPRPIVKEEIDRYGTSYALYVHVRPGATGLWQVSGRNNLSYEDRVQLDVHYVRNWSVWLDLYVLSRTILIMVTGRGAY